MGMLLPCTEVCRKAGCFFAGSTGSFIVVRFPSPGHNYFFPLAPQTIHSPAC